MTRTRIHRGHVTVEVDADIDLEDVLSEVSDEALRKECAHRASTADGAGGSSRERFFELADDIRDAFVRQDRMHLEVLILRLQSFAGVPRMTIPHPAPARAA